MLNVGDLFANLSLVTTEFTAGLSMAVTSASVAANEIGNAFKGSMNGFNQAARDLNVSTKNIGDGFKDVSRIVQGILISQTFYAGISAIKEAISAVQQYNMELEQTNVAFQYLLGSAQQGKLFVKAIQDFAATTPFTTQTASAASRQLMAMGFAANQVLPTLRILSDASAVSGASPETFNRIVYALGQIKTTGKLMTRDLMQLAQAGLPVYQILQDQLHLTAKQMQNIGKAGIDSSVAIQAILSGLEKRYAGAAQQVSKTTLGLLSTLKDDFLIVTNTLTGGLSGAFRNILSGITGTAEKLRQIASTKGIGGLLQAFFPPEMQTQVRAFAEYMKLLILSIGGILRALAPVGKAFINAFITTFNLMAPPIILILKLFGDLIGIVTRVTPLLYTLIFTIMGFTIAEKVATSVLMLNRAIMGLSVSGPIATLVSMLAKSVRTLWIAMVENPIVAVVALIAGAILSIALSSQSASQWLDRMTSSLGRLFGFNTEDMWKPLDPSQVSGDLSQFYGNLQDFQNGVAGLGDAASGSMDGAGDAAKDAGKAIKDTFVASFDELHQIPDPKDSGSGGSGIPKMPNIPLPDFKLPPIGDDKNKQQVLPPFKWPTIPPFPPLPPLPKIPIDQWGDDFVNGVKAVFARVRDVFTQPWPNLPPVPVPSPDTSKWKPDLGRAIGDIGKDVLGWVSDEFGEVRSVCADFGSQIGEQVGEIGQHIADGVSKGISNAKASISGYFRSIEDEVGQMSAAVMNGFETAFDNIKKSVSTDMAQAYSDISKWWADGYNGFVNFGNNVATSMGTTWQNVQDATSTRWAAVTSTLQTNWANLTAGAQTFGNNVKDAISNKWTDVYTATTDTWSAVYGIVSSEWSNIYTNCQNTANNVANAVHSKWSDVQNWTKQTWDNIYNGIQGAWDNIYSKTTDVGQSISAKVNGTWQGIYSNTMNAWSNVKSFFAKTWDEMYDTLSNIGPTITNMVHGNWSDILSNTQNNWQQVKDAVAGAWDKMFGSTVLSSKNINDAIDGFLDGVKKLFDVKTPAFVAVFAGALSILVLNATSAGDKLKEIFGTIGGVVMGVFVGIRAAISTAMSSIVNGINSLIGSINNIHVAIPDWVPQLGGKFLGFNIGYLSVPAFETGGIVDRDQIVRVGEKNKREAIIPLQNETAMAPFADAVAERINKNGASTPTGTQQQPPNILYVGTLIADERSLKQLERKMQVIRVQEAQRKGGK